jgi:hypothetical protein
MGPRDHRGAARVDGLDDLGVVNALQIDRRDAKVAVAEQAPADDERHAFAGPSRRHGVAELVRREAPPDTGRDGGPAQVVRAAALDHWRPRVGLVRTPRSGPTGRPRAA